MLINPRPVMNNLDVWQWYVDRRIARPEAGYPASEARYATVDEWILDTQYV